jgi:hypothetical protein
MESDTQSPEMNVHQPTVDLIKCAYPDGIPNAHYLTLLSILEKDASTRVLAKAIANIRGGNYAVYMNDVIESQRFKPDDQILKTVMDKLILCGYDEWSKE